MTDLLPPSPAPFPIPTRPTKSPYGLPQPNSTASSSSTSLNSLGSHPNLSSSDLRLGSDTSMTTTHTRSLSLGGSQSQILSALPHDAFLGPPIRPLDLGPLMHSHDATHAELARTVDELQQWMSVVEAGLTHMLDRTTQDTIEEEAEAEDVIVLERNGRAVRTHAHDDSLVLGADLLGRSATPNGFSVPVGFE